MRPIARIFLVALMVLALPAGSAFAQTTDGTVTVLADQLITDGLEDISIPETDEEKTPPWQIP